MKYRKKKILFGALALVLAVAVAGCGGNGDAHTHTPEGEWLADAQEHWKRCSQCEERTEVRKHTLDELSKCTVCNSEVLLGSSFASVYTYDDRNNLVRVADYDLEGNLTDEMIYENEYDAQGNVTVITEYEDGRLVSVSEYALRNGQSEVVNYTYYDENGTKLTNEYDENGNVSMLIDYDAEGREVLRTQSSHAQDAEGQWYESECTETYADGRVIKIQYDVQGSATSRMTYEADGTLSSNETWEYTYYDNNFVHTEKAYDNGVLVKEIVYQTVEESGYSYNFAEAITTYYEDGTYGVCTYNEYDELITETFYDADGNVI